MGIFRRRDSPFWWITLPRRGGRQTAFSTGVPVQGVTPEQTRDNRRLAEAIWQAKVGDLARRRFGLPSSAPVPTFREHAAWYLEHRVPQHRGALRESWALQHLVEHFGRLRLDEITPGRWHEYVSARRKAAQPATIGRELTVLKGALAAAVGEYLDTHPLADVRRPTVKTLPKRTLTAQEADAIAQALATLDDEIRDLFLVGLGTLLRQASLVNLLPRHVRPDRVVVPTKTGPHQVPLDGPTDLQRRAAGILRARLARTPRGPLFPRWQARFAGHADTGHARVYFSAVVKQAVATVDIPWGLGHGGVVWHTMTRATGATLMLRDYHLDIRSVQLLGGWSSLDQMSAYLGMDRTALGLRMAP